MTLEQLAIFIAVAEREHLTRAADAIHLTPSAVSSAIKNLEHLVATLRDTTDEFVVLAFGGRKFETLVFPRKEMVAATEEILSDNGIRAQGSADMMATWTKAANTRVTASEKVP